MSRNKINKFYFLEKKDSRESCTGQTLFFGKFKIEYSKENYNKQKRHFSDSQQKIKSKEEIDIII